LANDGRILIADDQADVLEALRLLLKGEGFGIESANSPAGIMAALETSDFDVVLMDLNYTRDTTSGQEGLDLLSRIHSNDPSTTVVVMTAWGSVDLAVEAMRRGARDFVQKPWDNARLLAILRTQVELSNALKRGQRLEAENRLLRTDGGPALIAESPTMQPVLQLIARVGPSDANVLITGEAGTGKEVVARTLHAVSLRASRPMVTVNAGGLAEGIFESELFGHVRGAFTDAKMDRVGRFELADSGTLFLDEIANVPLNLQAKMLRALEIGEIERVGSSKTKRVDVRVISATNARLAEEVGAGRFAVPAEHRRDPFAGVARAARGYLRPGLAFPGCARPPVSQGPARLRSDRHAGAARQSLAGQCPRAESCNRARCTAGAGYCGSEHGSGSSVRTAGLAAARRHEPGRGGSVPHQESAGAVQR
jgi:DNA-binding NtrC family response regulator